MPTKSQEDFEEHNSEERNAGRKHSSLPESQTSSIQDNHKFWQYGKQRHRRLRSWQPPTSTSIQNSWNWSYYRPVKGFIYHLTLGTNMANRRQFRYLSNCVQTETEKAFRILGWLRCMKLNIRVLLYYERRKTYIRLLAPLLPLEVIKVGIYNMYPWNHNLKNMTFYTFIVSTRL